jgi:hypothetical protein
MWDADHAIFSDVDPDSMQTTGVRAAVCFYPLMVTDCIDDGALSSLLDHLENPREFGTAYPWPSSSLDDPMFSAEPAWNGRRHNCPWNGRVWPMTTSHLIEGLIRQWRSARSEPGAIGSTLPGRCHRGPGAPDLHPHDVPWRRYQASELLRAL